MHVIGALLRAGISVYRGCLCELVKTNGRLKQRPKGLFL